MAPPNADELLRDFVLYQYKRDRQASDDHLVQCPDAVATNVEGDDGRCGEGTCEIVSVDATISCGHFDVFGKPRSVRYEWSDFGSFTELYDRLDEWKAAVEARDAKAERDARVAEAKKLASEAALPALPDVGGWVRVAGRRETTELVVTSWTTDRQAGRITVTLTDPGLSESWDPADTRVVEALQDGRHTRDVLSQPTAGGPARYSGLRDGSWMCNECGALVVNQHYHDRWHRSE